MGIGGVTVEDIDLDDMQSVLSAARSAMRAARASVNSGAPETVIDGRVVADNDQWVPQPLSDDDDDDFDGDGGGGNGDDSIMADTTQPLEVEDTLSEIIAYLQVQPTAEVVQHLTQALALGEDDAIQDAIDLEVVPLLNQLMHGGSEEANEDLIISVIECLTVIGEHQAHEILEVAPLLYECVAATSEAVAIAALVALASTADYSPVCRDELLGTGALMIIVPLVHDPDLTRDKARALTVCLAAMCKGRDHCAPPWEYMTSSRALDAISTVLHDFEDPECQIHALEALADIASGGDQQLDLLMASGVSSCLVDLCSSADEGVRDLAHSVMQLIHMSDDLMQRVGRIASHTPEPEHPIDHIVDQLQTIIG